MAAGVKIVVPTVFTDPTLPKLRDDAVFPDAGGVMLLDTNHPLRPMGSSVAPGAVVPNLLKTMLKGLQAGAADADYDGALVDNASLISAGRGKFEKSNLGGIHMIFSQANTTTNSWGKVRLPAAAMAYMAANTGHEFYSSLWLRVTRASTSAGLQKHSDHGVGQFWTVNAGNAQDTVYPTNITRKNWRADGAVGTSASGSGARSALGGLFQAIDRTPIDTPVESAGVPSNAVFIGGNFGGGKSPSAVFYRAYIEDLTVSGRSWATVNALDFAEYTRQVLTSGGRSFGDTVPTDPTTIP